MTEPPRHRLCRDCLGRHSDEAARCPSCGSPRSVDLEASAGLHVAHVDCDAFYASVEKRDNADLRDKPVIVGGLGARGVVSTCCYIARTFGVRSAMPMARALALCPDAVVLPPDMGKYARAGRDIGGFRREVQPRRQHWFLNEKSGFPFRTPAFCSVSRGQRRLGEKEYRAPSVTPGVALRPRTQDPPADAAIDASGRAIVDR